MDSTFNWGGINLNNWSDDGSTILENCTIEHAINGVYCQSSSPTITNNIFRNNIDGIESDAGSRPLIVGNNFSFNQYPVKIYGNDIDGNLYDNFYENNQIISDDDTSSTNYIYVYGESGNGTYDHLYENKTYDWLKDGAPYRLTDHIQVWFNNNSGITSILKIHPGVEVASDPGKYFWIGSNSDGNDYGALQADSVTFTASSPNSNWVGINMYNYSRDELTYLNNCIIEYAVNGVYTENSRPIDRK